MILKKQVFIADKKVNPLIGMLLFLISVVLFIATVPLGFVYGLLQSLYKKGIIGIGEYLLQMAISIDQLGNVAMQHLLNILWIKPSGYKFGNRDETISSALGRNHKLGTLTGFGKLIDNFLNRIDKNHSLNSIDYYIEPTPEILDLLCWIHIKDFKVLVFFDKNKGTYSLPATKKIKGEPDAEGLYKYLMKTLNIVLEFPSFDFLGIFEAQTGSQKPIIIDRKTCYTSRYTGSITSDAANEEAIWLDYGDREKLNKVDQLIFNYLMDSDYIR
ncbi:NUDIX hydrolase [Arenibacter sp. 6A1]|uniref:NUDIX hydrolase n=1 Tax=Arenibacter sp. 6A1 TaxID=2720391 RepID=UPI0014458F6D|nr:NUDIX hydrolase [Arenibacter sp. 6A1]NKI27314.1 NUDIX hydrolase [Arenibacter sp. 6A1]